MSHVLTVVRLIGPRSAPGSRAARRCFTSSEQHYNQGPRQRSEDPERAKKSVWEFGMPAAMVANQPGLSVPNNNRSVLNGLVHQKDACETGRETTALASLRQQPGDC